MLDDRVQTLLAGIRKMFGGVRVFFSNSQKEEKSTRTKTRTEFSSSESSEPCCFFHCTRLTNVRQKCGRVEKIVGPQLAQRILLRDGLSSSSAQKSLSTVVQTSSEQTNQKGQRFKKKIRTQECKILTTSRRSSRKRSRTVQTIQYKKRSCFGMFHTQRRKRLSE